MKGLISFREQVQSPCLGRMKKGANRACSTRPHSRDVFLLLRAFLRKSATLACEQALLFGRGKRASRERASEGPFLCPSRLRRSLARSRETRFTRPNRRACSQATATRATRGLEILYCRAVCRDLHPGFIRQFKQLRRQPRKTNRFNDQNNNFDVHYTTKT